MSVYFGSSTNEELIAELIQRGFEVQPRVKSSSESTADTDLRNARAYEDTYSKGGFCDQVTQLQSQAEQLQADNARLREEFDELTNLPIKWYVSERETRFVFATTDDRDEFVKYIIGVKALASNKSS